MGDVYTAIDMGTDSIKIVVMENGRVLKSNIKSEVNIIMKTIERFNGQGYKTADELDRLNDLYELSDKEVNLPWYENWWKYTGKIGQDWLH